MYAKHHPSKEAFELFRKGTLALSDVERAGMRIDTKWMEKQSKKIDKTNSRLKKELLDDKIWHKHWKRRFGDSAKLGNRHQLAQVLVKDLGFVITKQTEHGEDSTDKEALADIHHPFVEKYTRMQGLHTAKSVWLNAIFREMHDGFLHPSYSLNMAITFRSSSFDPNVQNWPQRNEELKRIVRGCIIPRKGHMIIETDFKGIEVCVGCAGYHHDKQMIKYLKGEGDMHRDQAMECYMLKRPEQVSDVTRYCAKNMFVFPAFYGSFYPQLAKPLWNAIHRMDLKDAKSGRSLLKHLKKHGIKEMGLCDPEHEPVKGTFEAHIKKVEERFWKERFSHYAEWKQEFYEAYLKTGGFKTITGFAINGYLKRNAVVNYPIQGSAFHCLLWSLIQVNAEMKKRKMKSRIIGQIHDSMLGDVHVRERDDYLELVRRVTTVDLPSTWTWLQEVPIQIDVEEAEEGLSWYHKRKAA